MDPVIVIAAATAATVLLGSACYSSEKRQSPSQLPARVGPWVLGEKIGEGGMGRVYRARHVVSGRQCAIKLLPGPASERDIERFEREARLTAELNHQGVVRAHDFGRTPEGGAYYAMQLVRGATLLEIVERRGPLSAARVVRILSELCAALAAVHRAGVVHRDIKPDNVIVCSGPGAADRVKLVDFGLARVAGQSVDAELVVGTPLFISPEAIAAPQTVGPRSDIYSLGAVAYYLLTARPVFEGETLIEVLSQHLYAAPVAPSRVIRQGIPQELEQLVLECLAKNPLERPESAAEITRRLACAVEREVEAPACSELAAAA